ncbi:hypothetical protein [Gimesia maris]|uniref:hypothetical protein n=1 Tax=Gimesia maris TaxID=122 RepID=UPI00241C9A76|nr:hypothetical protein [Gimesia maris]|tara:strand:- start:145894 stop:146718 length:825 start_codon:yes stop_codon:yes gene_type:complete
MDTKSFPPRVHILLARDSPHAVVIRRGPAKKTCILGWDRRRHTFTVGQWLKGRIYERRCDISPDGSHWIYFAMNGKWDSETGGCWTAIARTPYLKALDLAGQSSTYYGGGLFIDNRTIWEMGGDKYLRRSGLFQQGDPDFITRYYGTGCPSVYYPRLERDGWKMRGTTINDTKYSGVLFEKELPADWKLIKIIHAGNSSKGQGVYWDEHLLIRKDGTIDTFSDWEWAEWADESLYYVTEGRLFQIKIINDSQLSEPVCLHDFHPYQFEAKPAPY